jgi:multisubunit Na+/H+ antiporter MnhG subunit
VLLVLVMIFCWLGVLGMWRMREPMQALHYLSVPTCGATVVLTAAVFSQTGNSQAGWKTFLICLVLLGINSVVTHATAQAFRSRKLGHWQPLPGDPLEFVRERSDQ